MTFVSLINQHTAGHPEATVPLCTHSIA